MLKTWAYLSRCLLLGSLFFGGKINALLAQLVLLRILQFVRL